MKNTIGLILCLGSIFLFPACTGQETLAPADTAPKTDPRDAIVGTHKYAPTYYPNPDFFMQGHPLPKEISIQIQKDQSTKDGIIISGIHNLITVKARYQGGGTTFFSAHETGVKVKTVSGYGGKIIGTPDDVQVMGYLYAGGEFEYTLSLCGMYIVRADAGKEITPPKNNLPN